MNARILLAGLFALALPAAPLSAQTLSAVTESAQADLDQALKDLTAARERIASEKLPMSAELTLSEKNVAERGKEYDGVARAVDARSLEMNNLKATIKVRQDELNYISNLLDEFARGYDTRIHLAERPRYGDVISAALVAPQNQDLDTQGKLGKQLAVVQSALDRVKQLIGGDRFPGAAVTPAGTLEKGKVALIGPVALFASEKGDATGVLVPQTGGKQPAVRPLDEKNAAALAAVVGSGEGVMPFDPTRGSALKELMARASLVHYFKQGGPIMWPLLICSIAAVAVVIERVIFLLVERSRRKPRTVDEMMIACENGDVGSALRVGLQSTDFVARALVYALQHRDKGLSNALMRSTGIEMQRYERGVFILDSIITMAPLLGLLGTVTGMMHSFGMMGGADLGAPAAITGGIAEALIATAFGLGIALTALLPMNFVHSTAEKAQHELEDAATRLELVMKPITDKESQVAHRELLTRLDREYREAEAMAAKVNATTDVVENGEILGA